MKKTDWFILIAAAAYSYLFYEQTAGLNYLLFSLLLIALCLAQNTALLKEPSWMAVATGSLLSGFAAFFLGTGVTLYANIISLILLGAFSFKPGASLFIALLNSGYSLLMAIPTLFINSAKINPENSTGGMSRAKRFLLFVPPFIVVTVFFFLYRDSNPLFEKVTDEINLDFISLAWIFFTVGGFILMLAFFRPQIIKKCTAADENSPDQLALVTDEEHQESNIASLISLPNELFTGVILLALLNALLFFVNGTDIYFIYIIRQLPQGLSLSHYLHDGTNSIIISILLAIGIILFYFRGRLNFLKDNRSLRALAYIWIVQNIFMVATTAHRNYDYIANFGLTHKRIGVYIFLSLCIIGLVITFSKVYRIRSAWFMFRKNTWIWYFTLVIASPVNWDAMIANYNLKLAQNKNAAVDSEYLGELSYTALPALFSFYSAEKNHSISLATFNPELVQQMNSNYALLSKEVNNASWQTTCLTRIQAKKTVDTINKKGGI